MADFEHTKSVESIFQELYTLVRLEGKLEDQRINDLLLRRKLRDLFELLKARGMTFKDEEYAKHTSNTTIITT